MASIFESPDLELLKDECRQTIESGKAFEVELPFVSPSTGRKQWVRIYGRAETDGEVCRAKPSRRAHATAESAANAAAAVAVGCGRGCSKMLTGLKYILCSMWIVRRRERASRMPQISQSLKQFSAPDRAVPIELE